MKAPELVSIARTPQGIKLTFRAGTNCSTRIFWKNITGNDETFTEVEGTRALIPVDGWRHRVSIRAECVQGERRSVREDGVVPQWQTAKSCDHTEYLRVYKDDDQVTLLPLWADKSGPQCKPCKDGADCSGEAIGVAGTLPALPGYWQVPWNALGKGDGQWGQRCIIEEVCNATGCAPPHAGPLCGMCEKGARHGTGRECVPCPEDGAKELQMVGILLLASVALAYLIYDGVVGAGNIEESGVLPFHTLALRTLISYLQVASMIQLYELKLPAAVEGLIAVETVASSAGDTMVGIDCVTSASPMDVLVAKQVIVSLAPIVLFCALALFHVVRVLAGRVKKPAAVDQFVAGAMVVLNLLYPTLVKRSARMFSCRSIGGRYFLDEALDVECWKAEHTVAYLATALPGVAIYVVGFPAALLVVLLRLKKRGALKKDDPKYDGRWVLRLGFLFAGYEDEFVHWESIVLARKASLSAMAVFLANSGTTVQVVVAVLILLICLFLQMKYEPLEHDWHDLMEERSLMSSNLILIACLLANAGRQGNDLTLTASISLSLFVFVITLLFLWTTVRLTLIGMAMSKEGKESCGVTMARKCLRRLQCCCFVVMNADTEESKRASLALTAKGRHKMGRPRPVADPGNIAMIDLGDKEWTMMPGGSGGQQRGAATANRNRWKRRYSQEDDDEYFENVEDGEVSWAIPEGGVLEDDVLPEGWKRRYSAEYKKYYYENEMEGRTVWDADEIDGAV